MVDAAHIAGLIAGGAHPSPVPYADVVTFTTHKTLRGPRAGAILCREQYAAAIDKAVFPGLQGGPLMHVVAAKAVAFQRGAAARVPRLRGRRSCATPQALADALADEGFRIVSGGTDNHLMLVDLRPFGVTGKVAQEALDRAGITCNKNAIPNDPEKPFVTSGLRLGTAAVTTAGMGEPEMREIASLIAQVLRKRPTTTHIARRRPRRRRPPLRQVHPVPRPLGLAAGSLVRGLPHRRRGRRGRHVPPDVRRCAGSRPASARSRCPGRAACTRSRRRRSAARRCSSGSCVAMAVASQIDQFHEMFAGTPSRSACCSPAA